MTTEKTKPPSRRWPPAPVWALAALLVWCGALAAAWGLAHVENDLTSRGEQALADAGIVEVSLSVDGRDVELSAPASGSGDIEAAAAIVRDVRGVRSVRVVDPADASADRNDGALSPAPEVAIGLQVNVDGDRVLVVGSLPETVRAPVVAATASTFGNRQIADTTSQVEISDEPAWLGDLPGIVTALRGLQTGTVSISSAGVVLAGSVGVDAGPEELEAAVDAATELEVRAHLEPADPASFSADAEGRSISMDGTLPSYAIVSSVVTAAGEHHSDVNSMIEVAPVARPPWVDVLPDLLAATTDWEDWAFDVTGQTATFSGTAPSSSALVALRDGPLTALGVTELSVEAEVDPEAVAIELTELLEGSATFEAASATLSAEARLLLDDVVVLLRANPSTQLTVQGHTDNEGDAESNLRLSQERAEAVVDYLVAAGIAADRLDAIGYGETRPVADNGTAEGRAANRRIEFVVEQGEGGA